VDPSALSTNSNALNNAPENTSSQPRVYLDHAATGWPKPASVFIAMEHFGRSVGAAAGRGAYRSAAAADEVVASCRRRLARLINCPTPQNVAFFSNGTTALNAAILGIVGDGDHVVTTAIEHNSVLRPLEWLRSTRGVQVDVVRCDALGRIDPAEVLERITPRTKLVAISHASNVTGALQDVATIGRHLQPGDTLLLCDAAQTLGYLPIDMQMLAVDLLAAPGHKGACGPLGTGMLAVSPKALMHLRPTVFGGTGSISQSLSMPTSMPAMLEPGNLNVIAIAGWDAGLRELTDQASGGIKTQALSELRQISHQLRHVTQSVPGIRSLCGVVLPDDSDASGLKVDSSDTVADSQLPIASLTFAAAEVSLVASLLDVEFGIEVRAGLHCASIIHDFIGTAPHGTLRVSAGHGTTSQDLDRLQIALVEIMVELMP